MAAGSFPPSGVHEPGGVFWLPPRTGLPEDRSRWGHPHALIVEAAPGRVCTLVYGSSQKTEAASGARFHAVRERRTGVAMNGLTTTTYFYPGVLAMRPSAELPKRGGWLGKELKSLREKLHLSLGIGSGRCGDAGHLRGSWRGRIVFLTPPARRVLGTELGVVVTEPAYSRTRRFQTIVPIYDGTGRQPASPVVAVSSADWMGLVAPTAASALLLVPSTVSIWHATHLHADSGHVLAPSEMNLLDGELGRWFGTIPPTEP